jgi:hypothetical protein
MHRPTPPERVHARRGAALEDQTGLPPPVPRARLSSPEIAAAGGGISPSTGVRRAAASSAICGRALDLCCSRPDLPRWVNRHASSRRSAGPRSRGGARRGPGQGQQGARPDPRLRRGPFGGWRARSRRCHLQGEWMKPTDRGLAAAGTACTCSSGTAGGRRGDDSSSSGARARAGRPDGDPRGTARAVDRCSRRPPAAARASTRSRGHRTAHPPP